MSHPHDALSAALAVSRDLIGRIDASGVLLESGTQWRQRVPAARRLHDFFRTPDAATIDAALRAAVDSGHARQSLVLASTDLEVELRLVRIDGDSFLAAATTTAPDPLTAAAVLARVDAGIALTAADSSFQYLNDAYATILGQTREELLGAPCTRVVDPAEVDSALARHNDIIAGRCGPESREFPVVRRDGSRGTIESTHRRLVLPGGEAVRLSTVRDITDHLRLEAQFREIFEHATEGIYRSSPEGRLLQANPALARMHGLAEPSDLIAAVKNVARDWYAERSTRDRLRRLLNDDGRVEGFVARVRRVTTGEHFWTSENVRLVRADDGSVRYLEGTVRDITTERRLSELGHARGEILEFIARDHPLEGILYEIVGTIEEQFQRLSAGIFELVEGHLRVIAAPGLDEACIRALDGQPPSTIGGTIANAMTAVGAVTGGKAGMPPAATLAAAMRDAGYARVIAVPVHDQRKAVLGLITVFAATGEDVEPTVAEVLAEMAQMTSIAFEQARLARELVRQAHYDPLTDLPNRSLLHDRLECAIAEARREATLVAVLLLDLDEFKLINDTMGHSAGDDLLREVAQRLRQQTRADETIARLGGDEFVLVARIDSATSVQDVAERLLQTLNAPFHLGHQEVSAHPSIGISLYPDDGDSPEALLQGADTAMYAAKHAGKNQYRFFAGSMNEQITHRLRIETGLRQALAHNNLVLHFQPRVDLETGAALAAECLVRWPQAGGGLLPPGEFLPVAERSALIERIDRYVLERAIHQLGQWQRAGHDLVLAVNISARTLQAEHFAADVAHRLADNGVNPAGLELEITESMLMQDFTLATGHLRDLKERARGVRIAIDDFGSGYSSLSYLRHLPIDTLKIDRSFIVDLQKPETAESVGAIVRTIVDLGRNLQLNIVAEGVETRGQADLLRRLGCHEAQGFQFSPAIDADALRRWLT